VSTNRCTKLGLFALALLTAACPLRADLSFDGTDAAVAEDYPSVDSAIDALAGPVANEVSAPAGASVTRILIGGTATEAQGARAGAALVKRLPGSRYQLANGASNEDGVLVEVDVTKDGQSPVPWQAAPPAHGTVRLTAVTGAGRRSFAARYQEKPWADDATAFANANPDRKWVVGRSRRPWASQEEAGTDALGAAADALLPMVRLRGRDDDRLRQSIVRELKGGRLVADRFMQRFARPYGDVWYESVLVDASSQNVQSLADRLAAESRTRTLRMARALAASAAVVLALCVAYASANALTKGYFTGRLRVATLVLAVIGLGVVFAVTRFGL
jgi:hypothetical protein